jgi:putative DNA methylase
VIIDPPYEANVMYAELADFFYVWLKRTAGLVYPELFRTRLTDKDNEAVANQAKYAGQKGAKALAVRDYRDRMERIFAECRRVLKPDGIMTLMFTHKATGAWDALTKGLVEAGFVVTASWPINTEAEGSLHIKDKAAANSTIFLVCRPRIVPDTPMWWEDLEHEVARNVRDKVGVFQKAGIRGVDLYLSAFGPALEAFSRHWPVKRSRPRPEPVERRRRRQAEIFEEAYDPFAATPEDALDVARREVKAWRLRQLARDRRAHLDPLTEFFVLAWDAFDAPKFPFDEALHLARVVGLDMDRDVIGRIAAKKGDEVSLWDSETRIASHGLGPADGSLSWLDALHHAACRARRQSLEAAVKLLEEARVLREPAFLMALEAVLEVLPPSRAYTGFDPTAAALPAASDFEALDKLRRLALADEVDEPEQLALFREQVA